MCGVLIDKKDIPRLETIGVKDSKLLTPKKRESLIDSIQAIAKGIKTIIIHPLEVDAAVESDSINLNWLEALK